MPWSAQHNQHPDPAAVHPLPKLVFSVDVECWGQSVLDRTLPIRDHAADNLRRMLHLLAEAGDVRATFFVLGKFAERHPDAVREIQRAGHEIASHGYGHVEAFRQSPTDFRQDIRRAGHTIADLTGTPPTGYRAPVFSITRTNLWALQILAEEGYRYDSSIYPFAGPRYGIGEWPTESCRVRLPNGQAIVELPLTTLTLAGRRWPISGGGYARLLPQRLLCRALRAAANRRRTAPVFYCHPYELDADELSRVYPGLPLKRRLHQGIGRRSMPGKLRELLGSFQCCPASEALATEAELPSLDLRPLMLAAGQLTASPGRRSINAEPATAAAAHQ